MSRPLAGLLGAAVALLLPVNRAAAHAIESSLDYLGGANRTYALQSRFSSGVAAAGAAVTLVAPDGRSLALGRTDAQGELRFALPAAADGSWEVRVDQGPGHRDYLELPQRAASVPQPAAWATGTSLLLVGSLALRLRRPQL